MVKNKHIGKKVLSMILAIAMVLPGVCFFKLSGLETIANADTTGRITSAGYNVVIGVPETLYMTPQNNYNTTTTSVKYYVNNTVNTSGSVSLDQSNSATEGKFYIYSPQISSVNTVSVNGASLSSFGTSKNGSLFSDTSFTMTLSSGISSSQTKTLEWTINCTMTNGQSATFYAYTVAYAPYLSPIFSATKAENTRGSNSFGSGFAWASGIHGISTAGGYYPYNNFLPLCGGPTLGDTEDNPDHWFSKDQQCSLPTKGGWYTTKEYGYNYGDETLAVFERSGEGYINVDTSRYTNLNQIPNLVCGVYVSDSEGVSNGNVYAYIGKLTNAGDRITSGRNWYTRSDTSPSEWNASVTIYGGDRGTGRNKGYIIRDVRINNSVTSGWMYLRGAFKTASGGDNCFGINDIYLNVITADKSSWRTAVQNAQKYGFQSGWYSSSTDYNNWKSYLKSVAECLGNPTVTSCGNLTNLNNYTNTLRINYTGDNAAKVNDLGVVKVLSDTGAFSNTYKIVNISGVSNPVETESFYVGDTVALKSTTYTDYTYKCNVLMANQKAAGATFTNADLNTGLGSAGTGTTVTFNCITQSQASGKQQQRTFYYLGNDKTVTINPNGGSWNGSTSNTTVTGSFSGTFAPKNPTRDGWTFTGWTKSGGGSLSGSTYTFGSTAGTLTANWSKTIVGTQYYLTNNGAYTSETKSETITNSTTSCTITFTRPSATSSFDGKTVTFVGWSENPGSSTHDITDESHTLTDSKTFYAVYQAPLKLHYDINGGTQENFYHALDQFFTISNNNVTRTYHNTIVDNVVTPTKNYDDDYHYTFSCWNTQADGNGTDYIKGAAYPGDAGIRFDHDTTLYAKYTREEHQWDSGLEHLPTCILEGYITYTCTVCGKTKNEATNKPLLDHDYTETVQIITEATCTTSGEKTVKCSMCDAQKNVEIAPLGHAMIKTEAKAATCLEAGNNAYCTCSRCDKVFKDIVDITETSVAAETLAKLSHSYTGEVKCNNDGTHSFKCVNGCNKFGTAVTCTYGEFTETKAASVTEKGSKEKTCSVCGHKITEEIGLVPVEINFISDTTETEEQTYDKSVTVPGNDAKNFISWNSSADGTGTEYQSGVSVTVKELYDKNTLDLYAQYAEEKPVVYDFALPTYKDYAAKPTSVSAETSNADVMSVLGAVDSTKLGISTENAVFIKEGSKWNYSNAVPASNVLYEETALTYAAGGDKTPAWTPDASGAKNYTQKDANEPENGRFGYAKDIYTDGNGIFSNGTYVKTTVDASNMIAANVDFTFTGSAFDLISACGTDTGIMLIKIRGVGNSAFLNRIVDTYYSAGSLTQVPILHEELAYGTYAVTVSAAYMPSAGALTRGQNTAVNGADVKADADAVKQSVIEQLDEMGWIIEDPDTLKMSWFDENSVLNGGTGNASSAKVNENRSNGTNDGTSGTSGLSSLTCYIDGVRIYEPIEGNDCDAYPASEKGAQYVNVINGLAAGGVISSSAFIAFIDKGDGKTNEISKYESLGGPENEVYLKSFNENDTQAITFNIGNISEYSKVMISLRAVTGTPEAAIAGSTLVSAAEDGEVEPGAAEKITVGSATEMYYDITEIAKQGGTVFIANTGSGMLGIGNLKLVKCEAEPVDSLNVPALRSLMMSRAFEEPVIPEEPETPTEPDAPTEPEEEKTVIEKVRDFFVSVVNRIRDFFRRFF